MRVKVNRKDVDGVLKAACPRYKGRKISVECEYIPKNLDSYWDEGCRSYYSFYNIADGRVVTLHSNHPVFEKDQPRTMSSLPVGVLLVCHQYAGVNQWVTIYCNPCDMPKQITA